MGLFATSQRIVIISGGQTGVDRAALDVALELGLSCGGWCPLHRKAENGPIPDRYPLREMKTADYPSRTRMNVRSSDATLVLTRGEPDRGTALTCSLARQARKPLMVVDLNKPLKLREIRRWIKENDIAVLNVAGPRESSQPGIHRQAVAPLRRLFKSLATRPSGS